MTKGYYKILYLKHDFDHFYTLVTARVVIAKPCNYSLKNINIVSECIVWIFCIIIHIYVKVLQEIFVVLTNTTLIGM